LPIVLGVVLFAFVFFVLIVRQLAVFSLVYCPHIMFSEPVVLSVLMCLGGFEIAQGFLIPVQLYITIIALLVL